MSVNSYEYEVMRAELLGLPLPEKRPEPENRNDDVATEARDPTIDEQDVDVQDGKLKDVSGGLDELNSILTVTQKKLNKFKVICGSLTNVFKIRIHKDGDNSSYCGSDYMAVGSSSEAEKEQDKAKQNEENPLATDSENEQKKIESQRTINLADKITTQTDRLDSMLVKAEQAEMSLSHQNKQIRSFLR